MATTFLGRFDRPGKKKRVFDSAPSIIFHLAGFSRLTRRPTVFHPCSRTCHDRLAKGLKFLQTFPEVEVFLGVYACIYFKKHGKRFVPLNFVPFFPSSREQVGRGEKMYAEDDPF